MSPDQFVQAAEAFVARHGRRAWWQVMADHRVSTLGEAIELRDEISRTLRDLEAA